MAIKGKSKGRTAKAVTRGPKPVYQPVKKPLLAKREFWLVIGTILGVALVVGLVAGFIIERNSTEQDELEQRMRAAVNTYRGEFEPILTTIGQARAPSGFDAFTEFGTAVAGPGGRDAAGAGRTRRRSSRRPRTPWRRARPPSRPCRRSTRPR